MLTSLIMVVFTYFIGSLSAAILTAKIMHLPDPRRFGSHNPGATNVLRIGNKKAAFFTLCGDMLKGFLPLIIAKYLGFSAEILALMALFAFLGHLWPLFFAFKGGKGVATFLGSILALSASAGLILFIIWIGIALLCRYASLASMITALLAPLLIYYFLPNYFILLIICIMSVLLTYKHKKNLLNLWEGKENQIGTAKH